MPKIRSAIAVGGPSIKVLPVPIHAQIPPGDDQTAYPAGQLWFDNSTSPPTQYSFNGNTWDVGGNKPATTSTYGTVLLTDDSEPVATKAYADALVIAGAPVATEVTAGIGELATNAEAVAGTPSTPAVALLLTPSNLASVFASPPAIGGTSAGAGTFTNLTTSGGAVSLGGTSASNFSLTGAVDLTLASSAGSIVVNAGEAAADAIDLNAASGGLDIDVALLASITSTRNNAQAILLEATVGGIDILASGAGAGEDIDIVATGSSVNISGTENAADAVTISAANGGIDITCGGAAGEDIDIVNTAGSININAGEAVTDAINVDSSGGIDVDAVGVINIASSANGASAVVVTASAGGVDITATGASAGEDINITATGSSVNVTSTENVAQAIYLRANGGTSETVQIHADQGTGAASINVLSDVGGITLSAGLATADAINIVASNAAGGIDIDSGTNGFIVDTTGAISLDAAAASNFTATGAFDVTVSSTAGSINISGGEAAADAINIDAAAGGLDVDVALQMNLDSNQAAATAVRIIASNAAGGIDIDCGTGGATFDSTGAITIDSAGVLELNSSAGIISVGNDAVAQNINVGTGAAARTITIGNSTGATSVVINSGTGALNVGTNATAHTTTVGSTTTTSSTVIQSGTGDVLVTSTDAILIDAVGVLELNSSAGVIGIGNDAVAQNINVGTGAAARTITIGNVTGATAVAVNTGTGHFTVTTTGTGDIIMDSDDTMLLDADGVLELNSSAGAISIGNDADAQSINIGTGAAARTITVGNSTGATALSLNVGTGALNLGTNAVAHTVTLGSTTGAATTVIQSGTGGMQLAAQDNNVSVTPATNTSASPTASSTVNARVGSVSFTGFTTASAGTQTFTITNSLVTTSSVLVVTITNEGGNDAQMSVQRVKRLAGSFEVYTKNNGAAALNGNVGIHWWLLS